MGGSAGRKPFCAVCAGRGECRRYFTPEGFEGFIKALCEAWGLPEGDFERAVEIFHRVAQRTWSRGDKVEAAIACVFAASRRLLPFSSLLDLPDCIQYCERSVKRIYFKIIGGGLASRNPYTLRPVAHALGIARRLNLPVEVMREAAKLAVQVEGKRLHLGKSPGVVGAAVTYIAALRCGVALRDVAGAAGVSSSTVRHAARMIAERLSIQLPKPRVKRPRRAARARKPAEKPARNLSPLIASIIIIAAAVAGGLTVHSLLLSAASELLRIKAEGKNPYQEDSLD